MHTVILAATLSCLVSQQDSTPTSPTPPASPSAASAIALTALPTAQQKAVALGALGLSPEALAASGFTPAHLSAINDTARQHQVLPKLQTRLATATASSSMPAPSGSDAPLATAQPSPSQVRPPSDFAQQTAAMRRAVVKSAIPNVTPAQLQILERCIEGSQAGLPMEIAAACATQEERSKAAAALRAESRAARLNRPLAQEHVDFLSVLRAKSEVAAASQGLVTHAATMRQSLSASPSVGDTP